MRSVAVPPWITSLPAAPSMSSTAGAVAVDDVALVVADETVPAGRADERPGGRRGGHDEEQSGQQENERAGHARVIGRGGQNPRGRRTHRYPARVLGLSALRIVGL